MPTFEYQAQASDGKLTTGVVYSASLDKASQELSQQGLNVMRIGIAANPNDPLSAGDPYAQSRPAETPRAEVPTAEIPNPDERIMRQRSYVATSVWGPLVGKVSLTHLHFFFRQLSTMMNAGVPYVQALDTLSNQAKDPKFRGILRELKTHVEAGRPISFGMQRYPEVFSPVMLSLVRAGEEGGFLDASLSTVADYIQQEIELRSLYRRVTFYPKLQIGASIVIVIATNLIIASLGKQGGLKSPLTEPTTWMWLGPLIVGIFLFLRVGLANPRVKQVWDTFITGIPYIGNTLKQLAMAKFGRAFGALYKGGVPIQRSFLLAADACGNEFLRARMYTANRALEGGSTISEAFRNTNAFSPIVLDMVTTGETTGSLDQMLTKVSEYYEDESKTRSTQTGLVVGVVMGLLVAVYIGYVVITFYTGYFGNIMKEVG